MSNYTRWNLFRTVVTCGVFVAFFLVWLHFYDLKHINRTTGQEMEKTESITKDYQELNKEWFKNKLSSNIVIGVFHNPGVIAETSKQGDTFVIVFNPEYNKTPVQTELTLFHEMCHIETWGEFTKHGKQWEACMHRLAMEGAFDTLW